MVLKLFSVKNNCIIHSIVIRQISGPIYSQVQKKGPSQGLIVFLIRISNLISFHKPYYFLHRRSVPVL
jgi:hypothetical protein